MEELQATMVPQNEKQSLHLLQSQRNKKVKGSNGLKHRIFYNVSTRTFGVA